MGSSLQLSLEDKSVQAAVEKYVRALSSAIDGHKDVIGFAYAIDGKLNTAELYATRELFRKLWPKLLKSSATEALAEHREGKVVPRVTAQDVRACFADAEKAKGVRQVVSERTEITLQETERNILLMTRDRRQKGGWIHKTYLTKE